MADDDWRSFKLANNLLVMIDNVAKSQCSEAARIAAKLFNVAFHAGPVRGNDAITFVGVVFDPVFPTERGHPKAWDENDSGDVHCEKPLIRASCSLENSRMSGGRK